jgi:hypothetical protein
VLEFTGNITKSLHGLLSINIFAWLYYCPVFSKFLNNRTDFKMPEAEAIARS